MSEINENISSGSIQSSPQQIEEVELSNNVDTKLMESYSDVAKLKEIHRHEVDMIKYGAFGRIFGAEENSSKNLTFSLLLILLCIFFTICIISTWFPNIRETAVDMFQYMTPLITLAFGYFFGKK